VGRLQPEKLYVEFRPCIRPTGPVMPRRYTLTHSDETAELFLSVGLDYAYDHIGPMRDEVLAEWAIDTAACPMLSVTVYVDSGEIPSDAAAIRYSIFQRELDLALEAIRYGDAVLFSLYPTLDYSPIIVRFQSSYLEYNKVQLWGMPIAYR
jgi:hypothetical protein